MPPFRYSTALTDLARRIHRRGMEQFEGLGIGPGQLQVLLAIAGAPGICQVALCRNLRLDKSVISRRVKRLLAAGYVQRGKLPDSPRSRQLYPSSMTRALMAHIHRLDMVEALVIHEMSKEDLARIREYLLRFHTNLDRQPEVTFRAPPHPDLPADLFRQDPRQEGMNPNGLLGADLDWLDDDQPDSWGPGQVDF